MSLYHPITPEQVLAIPAGTLADHSAEVLFQMKNAAADRLAEAKQLHDHLDLAIDFKWRDQARNLRLEAGKDTGVIHFDDGDVRITADLPKKIEWDQSRLAEITKRIADSYRVSETKFNAWPDTLKSSFEAARTVKTGKPSYRLALIKE